MLSRGVPAAWARAALRVHRCPQLVLRVGPNFTRPLERSRSVLTGAASSGMLARICVEDSFSAAVTEMEPHGFEIDSSHSLIGMAWSDNLFTFSHTPYGGASGKYDAFVGLLFGEVVWAATQAHFA